MSTGALRGAGRDAGHAPRLRIACLGVFLLFVLLAVSPALAAAAPVTTTTTTIPRASTSPGQFSDLALGDPCYQAVTFLSGAGVLSGYDDGTFRPGLSLTRAQAAKMLVKLWDAPPQGSSPFRDVDPLYAPYVAAAAAQGWITGYPDGSFRPSGLLTRQQMALILVRSLGWANEAKSLSPAAIAQSLQSFADADSVSPEARASMALLVERGLFQGSQGRLAPTAGLTRGQFSLVCYRAVLRGLAVVDGIRSGEHADRTRLVLDLSNNPGIVTTDESETGALKVDVAGAAVDGPGPSLRVGSGEVVGIATAQLSYRPAVVRATVTLAHSQDFSVFTLPPSDGLGYRVVIDVLRPPAGPPSTPPTTSPAPTLPPGSSLGARAVQVAQGYLGVPYLWGGTTPLGFDCSGLVQYVYAQVGIKLPRVAADQQTVGIAVPRDQLQAGDLVFFGNPAHHVGIYAGNGTMIDAPYTGVVVRYDPIDATDYAGARRVG
jgi:NlpC/P60 family/S-layer homology domain